MDCYASFGSVFYFYFLFFIFYFYFPGLDAYAKNSYRKRGPTWTIKCLTSPSSKINPETMRFFVERTNVLRYTIPSRSIKVYLVKKKDKDYV